MSPTRTHGQFSGSRVSHHQGVDVPTDFQAILLSVCFFPLEKAGWRCYHTESVVILFVDLVIA